MYIWWKARGGGWEWSLGVKGILSVSVAVGYIPSTKGGKQKREGQVERGGGTEGGKERKRDRGSDGGRENLRTFWYYYRVKK